MASPAVDQQDRGNRARRVLRSCVGAEDAVRAVRGHLARQIQLFQAVAVLNARRDNFHVQRNPPNLVQPPERPAWIARSPCVSRAADASREYCQYQDQRNSHKILPVGQQRQAPSWEMNRRGVVRDSHRVDGVQGLAG